jgi:2-phospho-L-lactate transferase/gluconeogenesis factor (CofD/UPF0052 family)
MINVVILNGGRGASSTIPALLEKQGLNITSIVNAYDDGKSTGEIRKFFGMLGPSDIRKVQELMLPKDDLDYHNNLKLFQYRFPLNVERREVLPQLQSFVDETREDIAGISIKSAKVREILRIFIGEFLSGLNIIERVNNEVFDFSDCSIMNCIYAGAFLACNRNIEQATMSIDRLFKLRGTVLPTSIEDKKLVAQRENGQILYSEAEIVELRSNVRVECIYLLDKSLNKANFELLSNTEKCYYLKRHNCYVGISSGVKLALKQADVIIYSAGTQHSSLYPTYISAGLAQTIADNHSAYKAFITNIGADYETPSYSVSDYIRGAHRYLNLSDKRSYSMEELFDVMLINKSRIKADETYVEFDDEVNNIPVSLIIDDFESHTQPGKHDGNKVIETILNLYSANLSL